MKASPWDGKTGSSPDLISSFSGNANYSPYQRGSLSGLWHSPDLTRGDRRVTSNGERRGLTRCRAPGQTLTPALQGVCLQKWGAQGNAASAPHHCSAELPAGALET